MHQAGVQNAGFSSGLGFIGSSSMLLPRCCLGLLRVAISNNMRQNAMTIANCRVLRAGGVTSGVVRSREEHHQRRRSDPATWAATCEWSNGTRRAFVYSGLPAIAIRTIDGAQRRVMWKSVEQKCIRFVELKELLNQGRFMGDLDDLASAADETASAERRLGNKPGIERPLHRPALPNRSRRRTIWKQLQGHFRSLRPSVREDGSFARDAAFTS